MHRQVNRCTDTDTITLAHIQEIEKMREEKRVSSFSLVILCADKSHVVHYLPSLLVNQIFSRLGRVFYTHLLSVALFSLMCSLLFLLRFSIYHTRHDCDDFLVVRRSRDPSHSCPATIVAMGAMLGVVKSRP